MSKIDKNKNQSVEYHNMTHIEIVIDTPQNPDIENQLHAIKNYLHTTSSDNLEGTKKKYHNIVTAGYQVFSRLPLSQIKPVVFRALYGTFTRLV